MLRLIDHRQLLIVTFGDSDFRTALRKRVRRTTIPMVLPDDPDMYGADASDTSQ